MTLIPHPSDSGGAPEVQALPVDLIAPGTAQARRRFDQAALADLAASIAASGVIQPVVVCGDERQGYRLLAGERRWRAAQRAGLHEIPAIVRNDLGADQAAIVGLIENLQRESLDVMETARGLAHLAEMHGFTHEAIAARIGKSRAYVTNFLRLQRLNAPVQQMLNDRHLSLGHAKILAGIEGARQTDLARAAVTRGLSVRQLERAAKPIPKSTVTSTPSGTGGTDLSGMERELSEYLGNAVRIRYDPERRRGELRVIFHDLDEFDGLLAKLGYSAD